MKETKMPLSNKNRNTTLLKVSMEVTRMTKANRDTTTRKINSKRLTISYSVIRKWMNLKSVSL